MVHLIFKNTYHHDGKHQKDLVSLNKSYKNALLKCIKKNFEIIENVFPFYDKEDEYGNNLFFKNTPQGKMSNSFCFLDWYDHKSLINFNQLYSYDVKSLKLMLKIQEDLIYPDYNGDFSETYYLVETWQIN